MATEGMEAIDGDSGRFLDFVFGICHCRSLFAAGFMSMPGPHPCALCSAMIASGFAETCPPETARFDHDRRICDACLSTDFSSPAVPELTTAVLRFVFSFSFLVAIVPGLLVLRHHHIRGWSLLLGSFALAAMAGCILVLLCVGAGRAFIWFGNRNYVKRKPAEAMLEAERFYCLALWAALSNKKPFARRMLAQAKRMGFADPSRLHDTAFDGIAA